MLDFFLIFHEITVAHRRRIDFNDFLGEKVSFTVLDGKRYEMGPK